MTDKLPGRSQRELFRPLLLDKCVSIVANISGFNVIFKRRVVERSFGWFNFNRRFDKDYELNFDCSTAFIHLTMCRIMLN